MTPDDVRPLPWQIDHWLRVNTQWTQGRLPHSLLLTGPAGVGKRHFARATSARLLCNHGPDEAPACGRCRDCLQLAAGSHPDFRYVGPESPEAPIKIDQIRELSGFLMHTSQRNRVKIVILEPADRLNINAANALLKTLEEPPATSLLLLVSTAPGRLPATVRSRCQRLAFALPPRSEAHAWLSKASPETADTELLLRLARGAPLLAREWADAGLLAQRRALFEAWKALLIGRLAPEAFAESCLEGLLQRNLGWLLDWHRDMIRLKIYGDIEAVNSVDLSRDLLRMAKPLTAIGLFGRLEALERLSRLIDSQTNHSLQLTSWLAGLADIEPSGPFPTVFNE
jgi:DNA polymerase III subunit delta'